MSPSNETARTQSPEISRPARYGLLLFAIYLVLYGGFVVLNAFAPSVMENTALGISIAVLYGMGLIVAALVLALFYAWLCRVSPPSTKEQR